MLQNAVPKLHLNPLQFGPVPSYIATIFADTISAIAVITDPVYKQTSQLLYFNYFNFNTKYDTINLFHIHLYFNLYIYIYIYIYILQ